MLKGYSEKVFWDCFEKAVKNTGVWSNSHFTYCICGYTVELNLKSNNSKINIEYNGEDDNCIVSGKFPFPSWINQLVNEINRLLDISCNANTDSEPISKNPRETYLNDLLHANDGRVINASVSHPEFSGTIKYKIWGGRMLAFQNGKNPKTDEEICGLREATSEERNRLLRLHAGHDLTIPRDSETTEQALAAMPVFSGTEDSHLPIEEQTLKMSLTATTADELETGIRTFYSERLPYEVEVFKTGAEKIRYRIWSVCPVKKMIELEKRYQTFIA